MGSVSFRDERHLARVVEDLLAEADAVDGRAVQLVAVSDHPVPLWIGANVDAAVRKVVVEDGAEGHITVVVDRGWSESEEPERARGICDGREWTAVALHDRADELPGVV